MLIAVVFFAAALNGYLIKELNGGMQIGLITIAGATTVLCTFREIINSPVISIIAVLLFLEMIIKPFYGRIYQKVAAKRSGSVEKTVT